MAMRAAARRMFKRRTENRPFKPWRTLACRSKNLRKFPLLRAADVLSLYASGQMIRLSYRYSLSSS
ncbi:hypothetical protein B4135_3844 [Caldibacillus debilis]|uniref:Uncharacterized protein n=1 Tax=Caldibacillus debilis TaxID=301148 RepID=A0A150L9A4_9BACI|nr:hypothetical protein B4135_3844 [Caldibacillus debilis]